MTWTITLPLPPNRANQTIGQAKWEWARKKKYIQGTSRVIGAMHLARVAMKGRQCEGPVTIQATLYTKGKMDEDNLTGRLKWPLDTLVAAGIIRDDSSEYITLLKPIQERDHKDPRVELVLEER